MLIPRVGIGVVLIKDGHLLLGKRKNSHGADSWCCPGGHLDFMESPENCAIRETLEETGLTVQKVLRGPWVNDYFEEENRHYITLFMLGDEFVGEPKLMEPDKCYEWRWFTFSDLPDPLFLPLQSLIKNHYTWINNLNLL